MAERTYAPKMIDCAKVKLPLPLKRRLVEYSASSGVPQAEIIRRAIEEYLDEKGGIA